MKFILNILTLFNYKIRDYLIIKLLECNQHHKKSSLDYRDTNMIKEKIQGKR